MQKCLIRVLQLLDASCGNSWLSARCSFEYCFHLLIVISASLLFSCSRPGGVLRLFSRHLFPLPQSDAELRALRTLKSSLSVFFLLLVSDELCLLRPSERRQMKLDNRTNKQRDVVPVALRRPNFCRPAASPPLSTKSATAASHMSVCKLDSARFPPETMWPPLSRVG